MRPGDVIDYHGELHQISRVERRDGWSWPIAFDDAGWAIALRHDLVPGADTEAVDGGFRQQPAQPR